MSATYPTPVGPGERTPELAREATWRSFTGPSVAWPGTSAWARLPATTGDVAADEDRDAASIRRAPTAAPGLEALDVFGWSASGDARDPRRPDLDPRPFTPRRSAAKERAVRLRGDPDRALALDRPRPDRGRAHGGHRRRRLGIHPGLAGRPRADVPLDRRDRARGAARLAARRRLRRAASFGRVRQRSRRRVGARRRRGSAPIADARRRIGRAGRRADRQALADARRRARRIGPLRRSAR